MKTISLTVALLLSLAAACFADGTNLSTSRPANWAQPVAIPGITNCFQVTSNLYRGSQPSAEGMAHLKTCGIKTVINLRAFHSDKDELAGKGLTNARIKFKPWHAETEDVVAFLKVAADTNRLPVFVHCQRGADRTGTMCAMYRIAICGWTKSEALAEMKNGGFDFAPAWKNLVRFIEQADIQAIKQQAGLTNSPGMK